MIYLAEKTDNLLKWSLRNCVQFITGMVFSLALITPSHSQSITYENAIYSGKVKDKTTNEPLEGVIVEALHRSEYDTTSAEGEFYLSYYAAISGISHSVRTEQEPYYGVRNGQLHLNLPRQSAVAVSLYTLSGKRIFSKNGTWESGRHRIDLHLPATGIYLCMLEINRNRSSFRLNTAVSKSLLQIKVSPSTGNVNSAKYASLTSADKDTLYFYKPGYYPKYVPLPRGINNVSDVMLEPVDLKNGAPRGEKILGSRQGTTMSVYVNATGTTVDSIVANIQMHCTSISEKFTFSVSGPFPIPANGVVEISDSMLIAFTDTSATGSFYTRQIISKSTSNKCTWDEIYISGGAQVVKMMEHTNHLFSIGGPVQFYNTWYTLETTATHGTIKRSPDFDVYLPGVTVTLTAIPDSGYGFPKWNGIDSVTSELSSKVTIFSNRTVEATLGITYPLITKDDFLGRIYRVPDRDFYAPGDTVKLIAYKENYGYFMYWIGDTTWTHDDTAWVIMDGPKYVSVYFGRYKELSLNYKNGRIDNYPPRRLFKADENDTIRLVAIPDSGFRFLRWEGDSLVGSSNDTAWVGMSTSREVTAIFISDRAQFSYLSGLTSNPDAVALSPDNSIVAISVKKYVRLVSTQTGEVLGTIGSDASDITDLDFSKDGNRILFTNRHNYIEVWDMTSETTILRIDDSQSSMSAAFSPDNSLIASAEHNIISIWSVSDGTRIDSLTSDTTWGNSIAVSPDNKWVAVASQFDPTIVYSTETKSVFTTCAPKAAGFYFTQNSDSLTIISENGIITSLDLKTGSYSEKPEKSSILPTCASFSSDGKRIACGTWNRGIYLLDAETGNVLYNLPYESPITCIDYSRSGPYFLTGDNDGVFILWKAD